MHVLPIPNALASGARRLRPALILVAAIIVAATANATQADTDERGTLAWRAKRASEAGQTSIVTNQPTYAEMELLQDALAHTSAVIAQLIITETNHDDYHVFTWKKYRLLEQLSAQKYVSQEPLPSNVPRDMLPLAPGEFVTFEYGGTVNVNGVSVTVTGPEGNVPESESRHLLFVMFWASDLLALPNYGPISIFWVDSTDRIHPPVDDCNRNRIWSDINRLTGTRISALRQLRTANPVK